MTVNVRQVQQLLQYMGQEITADGIWGPESQEALDAVLRENTQTDISSFWKDIRYFTREEFRCQCYKYNPQPLCDGFPYEPTEKLVRMLDRIRERSGRPITIISGVRCEQHNRNVGGVYNSRHRFGQAADIVISGVSPAQMDAAAAAENDCAYHYIITNKDGTPAGDIHVDVVV